MNNELQQHDEAKESVSYCTRRRAGQTATRDAERDEETTSKQRDPASQMRESEQDSESAAARAQTSWDDTSSGTNKLHIIIII